MALFWLSERLNLKQKAVIIYLLTLWGGIPKHGKGIYNYFESWFWSHCKLEEAFPQLKGDLNSQMRRLLKQLKITFKVETRKKIKPRELRWMGVGYRDKGNLSKYSFSWKDVPTNPEQVLFQDLIARSRDRYINIQIEKAKQDLKIFFKFGKSRQRKKSNPTDETFGKSRNLKKNKISEAKFISHEIFQILRKLSPV
jgi:hypothetical protein